MIIWGQRLYGRVFVVMGVFYVATQFFHIWYIPLIPVESWIIMEGSESSGGNQSSWRGHRIPMNMKSVLFGWIRAATIVGALVGLPGIFAVVKHEKDAASMLLVSVASIVVYLLTKRYERATPDSVRAMIENTALAPEAKAKLIALSGGTTSTLEDLADPAA